MSEKTEVGTRETVSSLLARNYRIAHDRVLKVVDDLSTEQFDRPLHKAVHSIGWQLWHIARWDDRFCEVLVEKLPEAVGGHRTPSQIWNAEALTERWGLPAGTMGARDTGTSMDDEAAEQMRLPGKDAVVDYARRVFAVLDELIGSISDELLVSALPGDPDRESAGQNVMYYLDHVNRHLGMIEAMKGLQGVEGSATR